MVTTSVQFDRMLERITTHLRAQVAELRRLEQAGATEGELEERRELITRLQSHLAELVRADLAPPRDPSAHDPEVEVAVAGAEPLSSLQLGKRPTSISHPRAGSRSRVEAGFPHSTGKRSLPRKKQACVGPLGHARD